MTLLADPPEVNVLPEPRPAERSGRNSTWRFAARLARREVRRRPGRTLLVALLVAVPVAAMVLGSILVRTSDGSWAESFARAYGQADIAVDNSALAIAEPSGPPPALPGGTRDVEYVWTGTQITPTPASGAQMTSVTFTDIPLGDPITDGIIETLAGRAPEPGEMMIGPELADLWHVGIGDTIELARPSGAWRISGFGRATDNYWNQLVIVDDFDRARLIPPNQPDGGQWLSTITLYDVPDEIGPVGVGSLAAAFGGMTPSVSPYPSEPNDAALAWGWLAGTLALVAVGIIVAAAFATSARRQLVTVGQLCANGATPSLVRRTLALQGSWSGLVGAVVGIAGGFALVPLGRDLAERSVAHALPGTQISPRDLLLIAVTAVVVATAAAAVPARSVGRIPVMAALAGRRPLGKPPRWLVPTGLTLAAGGLALIAVAATGSSQDATGSSTTMWTLMIVLGAVGVVFGMCCSTPLVVERIGRIGRGMPLTWRMSVRSIGRSRTRSAAVVAAIAVAVGSATAGATIADMILESEQADFVADAPSDTFVLWQDPWVSLCCEGVVDPDEPKPVELPATVREQIDMSVPAADVVPLRSAAYDPAAVDLDDPDALEGGTLTQPVFIADPEVLDIFGFSDPDLATLRERGVLQGIWGGSSSGVTMIVTVPMASGPVTIEAPVVSSQPGYVMGTWALVLTPERARQLGFDLVPVGVVVRGDRPFDDDQRSALRTVVDSLSGSPLDDVFVEPGDPPRPSADEQVPNASWAYHLAQPGDRSGRDELLIRGLIVALALVITVGVVAIGLSLAAVEGRDERDVLVVVGARPASMRRQAATKALVLALAGIVLGIPTGFVPVWVLYRTIRSEHEPVPGFPWPVVATVLIVVPLVAAAVAWAGSGIAQRLRPVHVTHQE